MKKYKTWVMNSESKAWAYLYFGQVALAFGAGLLTMFLFLTPSAVRGLDSFMPLVLAGAIVWGTVILAYYGIWKLFKRAYRNLSKEGYLKAAIRHYEAKPNPITPKPEAPKGNGQRRHRDYAGNSKR